MLFLIFIAVVIAILFVPNVGKFIRYFTEQTVMVSGKAIAIGLDKADDELNKIDSRNAIEILEQMANKKPNKK